MANGLIKTLKSDSFAKFLVLTLLLASIVVGLINKNRREQALKNNTLIQATVLDVEPGRGEVRVYVQYSYNGVIIKNDFTDVNQYLDIGSHIILKVSTSQPDKYVEFVRKINNQK